MLEWGSWGVRDRLSYRVLTVLSQFCVFGVDPSEQLGISVMRRRYTNSKDTQLNKYKF